MTIFRLPTRLDVHFLYLDTRYSRDLAVCDPLSTIHVVLFMLHWQALISHDSTLIQVQSDRQYTGRKPLKLHSNAVFETVIVYIAAFNDVRSVVFFAHVANAATHAD
jgi:hypothetical protein